MIGVGVGRSELELELVPDSIARAVLRESMLCVVSVLQACDRRSNRTLASVIIWSTVNVNVIVTTASDQAGQARVNGLLVKVPITRSLRYVLALLERVSGILRPASDRGQKVEVAIDQVQPAVLLCHICIS